MKWYCKTACFIFTGLILLLWFRNARLTREVSQLNSVIDSVNIIASHVPDTVYSYDTIYPDPEIKWRNVYIPKYIYLTDSTRRYLDTITDQNYQVIIDDTVKGSIQSRNVGVQLFVPEKITIEKEIKKEVPVIITKQAKKTIDFYGGVYVPISGETFGITPHVDVVLPSGWMFGTGYTISNNGKYFTINIARKF